ncbi:AraC family transcriptional regulator ligand-binding domain-containing protein [Roseibium alexandrii]|uniref:AraC family transcriptional regulator n=1 Tax=Roseibium alexandrii TaxID=388408 RepID=UPI0039EF8B81
MPRISAYRLKHLGRIYAKEPAVSMPFEMVLSQVGIDPAVLTNPDAKIELTAEALAVQHACHVLGDPTFAARAGLAAPGAKTLLAYLARSSKTVRQVLEFAQKYYALEDSDLQFKLTITEKGPVIGLQSGVLAGHQAPRHRELLVCGMYMRIRQIAGPEFGPLALLFEENDPDHCKALCSYVDCKVLCGQPVSGVRLPVGGLDYPIPTADTALLDHLMAHGDARLEKVPQEISSLSSRVMQLVKSRLPGHLPSGDEVAEELCMTRRTLTRHLAAEGTNYKSLAEAARSDMAKQMLLNESSIAQVAFLLDFGDQAAFSVAFKRWTGTTPAQFKRTNG